MGPLLILLLPVLASCNMHVKMSVKMVNNHLKHSIGATGNYSHVLNPQEQQSFRLTDKMLFRAAAAKGVTRSDFDKVYLFHQPGKTNVYEKCGWSEVNLNLCPVAYHFEKENIETFDYGPLPLDNITTINPWVVKEKLRELVVNSIGVRWTAANHLQINDEITYSLEGDYNKVYRNNWGTDKTWGYGVHIDGDRDALVIIDLTPGQEAYAMFQTTNVHAIFKVHFLLELFGDVVFRPANLSGNTNQKELNCNDWRHFNIIELLEAKNFKTSLRSSVVIEVQSHTNARAHIIDKKTKEVIATIPSILTQFL